MHFVGFYDFPSSRWHAWAFLGFFGLLTVLHGVLDSNFKLYAFVVNGLIEGEIEKLSGQFLGLIVMSHWLWRGLNSNPWQFGCFTFILCSFGESHSLVSWCAGGRCGMTCNDEDRARSRRPDAEDRRCSHRSGTRWLGDREVGWRCVRPASCTWRRGARVSWLSLKTKVDGLSVVWHQNYWDGFFVWCQNRWLWFLRFNLKTGGDGFLVEPQNQGGGGFFDLGLKTGSYGLVIWTSKSPRRFLNLIIKMKQTTVCQLRHKTDGRMRRHETRIEI
jgi:hypothetical protein